MADYKFPVLALMQEVQAKMQEQGFTVPHLFGAKHQTAHGAPPRYVWVPTRIQPSDAISTRGADQFRTLFAYRAQFVVDVWGVDFVQANALMETLFVALHHSAFVNVELDGGTWARPGQAYNQYGEVLAIEGSLGVPIADRWFDPALINGAADPMNVPTIPEPERPTVIPELINADLHLTEDAEEDGELILEVSTP